MSIKFTVLPSEPLARYLPSGENATLVTEPIYIYVYIFINKLLDTKIIKKKKTKKQIYNKIMHSSIHIN